MMHGTTNIRLRSSEVEAPYSLEDRDWSFEETYHLHLQVLRTDAAVTPRTSI